MLSPWYTGPIDPASNRQSPGRRPPVGDPPLLGEGFVERMLSGDARYDARVAYALAVIAAWSYSDGPTLAKKIAFHGFPEATVESFGVTNHALFVVSTAHVVRSRCGRVAVVGFRGTEPVNLVSWLTDADVVLKAAPETWGARGLVHRGFLSNFEAIWADVEATLADDRVEAIWVTGHSLGGAMAVLAAAKLRSTALRAKLRGTYTFGQPAVGDADFAGWARTAFGDRLFRHEYADDIIPRMPPESVGAFAHFGTVYESFEERWRLARAPRAPRGSALWPVVCSVIQFAARRSVWLRWLRPWLHDSLDDHSPAFYLETSRNAAHAEARGQRVAASAPSQSARI